VNERIEHLEYQRKHLGMDDEEFVSEIGNVMSLEETSVLFRQIVKENQDLRRQLAECQANAPKYLRAQNMQMRRAVQLFEQQLSAAEDERDALRRQLAEAQAELSAVPVDAMLACIGPDDYDFTTQTLTILEFANWLEAQRSRR
jgi:hypothetical protein